MGWVIDEPGPTERPGRLFDLSNVVWHKLEWKK